MSSGGSLCRCGKKDYVPTAVLMLQRLSRQLPMDSRCPHLVENCIFMIFGYDILLESYNDFS